MKCLSLLQHFTKNILVQIMINQSTFQYMTVLTILLLFYNKTEMYLASKRLVHFDQDHIVLSLNKIRKYMCACWVLDGNVSNKYLNKNLKYPF